MKSDEGIFKMLSKSSIIRNQYENVIPINLKQKFKKGSFYCPFFMTALKIFNEVFNECSMKFPFQIVELLYWCYLRSTNEFKRTRCKNKNRQDANRGRMETAWLVKR